MKFHNWFFRAVYLGYVNLPEAIAARFSNDTHLRKWLLVRTGHFEEREFPCSTEQYAQSLATFVRTETEYSFVRTIVLDNGEFIVIVRRAKSQAIDNMNAPEFDQTAKDVLDMLESMIGIPIGTLKKQAQSKTGDA
jgi:hypothetical protein